MDYIYGGIRNTSASVNFVPTSSNKNKTDIKSDMKTGDSPRSESTSTTKANLETKSYVEKTTDSKSSASMETKSKVTMETHSNAPSNEETKSTVSLESQSNVSMAMKSGNKIEETVAMETKTKVAMETRHGVAMDTTKDLSDKAVVLKKNIGSSGRSEFLGSTTGRKKSSVYDILGERRPSYSSEKSSDTLYRCVDCFMFVLLWECSISPRVSRTHTNTLFCCDNKRNVMQKW